MCRGEKFTGEKCKFVDISFISNKTIVFATGI